MIHQALLIAVALAYSAAMLAVGRRLSRPASIAAYTTAVAVLFSVPLFPEQTVQRVDHVLHLGHGELIPLGMDAWPAPWWIERSIEWCRATTARRKASHATPDTNARHWKNGPLAHTDVVPKSVGLSPCGREPPLTAPRQHI